MPNYVDLRARATTLVDVYGCEPMAKPWASRRPARGAERVYAHTVTLSYFGVLGVRPAAGRMLTDQDRDRAIVLSHAFWTRRFSRIPPSSDGPCGSAASRS